MDCVAADSANINRLALEINDRERTRIALEGIGGKRLTYPETLCLIQRKSKSREAYLSVMDMLREIDYMWYMGEND